MSGEFGGNDGFYSGGYNYDQNTNYEMGGAQFGQDTQFGQFDYSQGYATEQSYSAPPSNTYTGSIMTPDMSASYASPSSSDGYEEEPPLLEELGINFDHITQKTLAVLNPFKAAEHDMMQDTDLAGPLVFCLAFGGSLMLCGKLQFGYIYGIGVVGCAAMYFLLNMMSLTGVSVGCVISVLGYCLLPMVILSFSAVLLSLKGMLGILLTVLTVVWCSFSSSKLFVSALSMENQQPLVAYPCGLVYGVFALLTVF
ncbi:protein YIPF5-like [Crassostrea virginica]|uniref:Protein YIPF n=1 Tax=Crassostrea virginica TaxID=6565 RepID=A0A8B8DKE6_CRAVI|nr:protein YIPF5-like [Crassostrea virginica]